MWSISRSFDVSITQLLSLNTIETFANGIPLIKEGDKIILSNITEITHLAYCRNPQYNHHFNFSELPNDEARSKCLEILEKELDPYVIGESSSKLSLSDDNKSLRQWDSKDKPKLDKRFWDIYLSDNRYIYFLENLSQQRETIDLIILMGALKGHKLSQDNVLSYVSHYFENFQDTHGATDIKSFIRIIASNRDPIVVKLHTDYFQEEYGPKGYKYNYKEFIDTDTSLLSKKEKGAFYYYMLNDTFISGDVVFYKKLRESANWLNSYSYSNGKILGSELLNMINFLYVSMNTDNYDIAREVIKNFFNKLQINDVDEFYNIAKKNFYSQTSDTFEVVETFVLNASAIEAIEQSPDEFLKNRIKYMELIETDLSKGRFGADELTLMNWYSDTGYRLSYFDQCSTAEIYFSKAFKLYETIKDIYRTDDIQEPLDLADCFLRERDYSKASTYTDLAEESLKEFKAWNKLFLKAPCSSFIDEPTDE